MSVGCYTASFLQLSHAHFTLLTNFMYISVPHFSRKFIPSSSTFFKRLSIDDQMSVDFLTVFNIFVLQSIITYQNVIFHTSHALRYSPIYSAFTVDISYSLDPHISRITCILCHMSTEAISSTDLPHQTLSKRELLHQRTLKP